MKRAILATAIIGMCSVALSSASAADTPSRRHSSDKGVSMVLIPEKTTVRLGEPIIVTLQIKTDEQGWIEPEYTNYSCFDYRFEITNAHVRHVAHVGISEQLGGPPYQTHIGPSSALTVLNHIDLTDHYLIREPGKYSIRFHGGHFPPDLDGVPDSNVITVDVMPGNLPPTDQFVSQLVDVLPKGWRIEKNPRIQNEVTSSGRSSVDGIGVLISAGLSRGAIHIWFTKLEAGIDPTAQSTGNYLGRAQGFFVYVTQDVRTPATPWPNAIADISRALGVAKN